MAKGLCMVFHDWLLCKSLRPTSANLLVVIAEKAEATKGSTADVGPHKKPHNR